MANLRVLGTVQRLGVIALAAALLGYGATVPAAHASALTVACGDTLTASVTLTADLTCAGDALTVGAANVTIDLNGHTIRGNGTGKGVQLDRPQGVAVTNGTITGFADGVYLETGAGITLTGVRLAAPLRSFGGNTVTVAGTTSNCELSGVNVRYTVLKIDDCVLTGSVSLSESNGSAIRDSELSNGSLNIWQSDGGIYTGNVFDAFPVSTSVVSRRNLFKSNIFANTATAFTAGAVYDAARAGIVEDNVFRDNDIGLRSHDMRNVIVRNNVFEDNDTAGMYLLTMTPVASPDALSGNEFVNNGHDPSGLTDAGGNAVRGGIHIRTGTDDPLKRITLANNTGSGNAGHLIWAPPGMVIDGGGNQGPCGPTPNPDLTCF
ncbi:hypothetical protein DP939_40950 [Spongiactinospora rosea]|uniref:Periplasmic copper-binding protein NosD beta helix domain-containing protein n=1 Tax=Spongiactinospora rosea TaxID=2248750 RepID=A0A366LKA7_9ACTN|nr:NosD domain-containing protein [Spongiactinospora rosea]RBQ14331.1 hypothetical protein DP939_40950 [Spongiactinospora rosea]